MENTSNNITVNAAEPDPNEEKIRNLQISLKKARTALREMEVKDFFSQKIIAQKDEQITKYKDECKYVLFKLLALITKIKRANEYEKKFNLLEKEKNLLQKRIDMLVRSSSKDGKTSLTPRERPIAKSIEIPKTQEPAENNPKPKLKAGSFAPVFTGFDPFKPRCYLNAFTKESSALMGPLLNSRVTDKQKEISDLINSLSSVRRTERGKTFAFSELTKKEIQETA